MDKLLIYGGVSTALTAAVISNALNARSNFYAAAVQIGRSSGAIMVLVNFCFFVTLCLGLVVKQIFFGQLRPVEIEHLYDRSWFFFTESMLALTIFRDEFDAQFILMFLLLLFLKCFHWICIDRVEYMDQVPPPGPPKSFHFRLATMLTMLSVVDVVVSWYCISEVIEDFQGMGGGGMVLFASEYTLLANMALTIGAKYVINLVDLRRAVRMGGHDAPPWEEKSMWVFYVDLVSDAIRLLTYGTFFFTIFTFFGALPINHLHSLYATIRSFFSKVRDLLRYRSATKNMDERYPDATEEEVGRLGGGSCVICREEMVAKETRERTAASEGETAGRREGPNETPKKLACGHVFHFHCLRSWLERQQSCPTCRRTVLDDRHAPTTPTAARPPPPQPGQAPVAPAAPRSTAGVSGGPAAAAGPTSTGPIVPPNGNLGIWGPPNVPMTIQPNAVGAAAHGRPAPGLGLGPTPPWPQRTLAESNAGPTGSNGYATEWTSRLDSPMAITPVSSQAPMVFTPPSESHFERPSQPTGEEMPAQLAAAAAMRRLQKMSERMQGETAPREEVKPSNGSARVGSSSSRSPYLVPLRSSTESPFPWQQGVPEPKTAGGLLASLSCGFDELDGVLASKTQQLRHGFGGGSSYEQDADAARRELGEYMRALEALDRRVGDSLDEVAVALSLLPPCDEDGGTRRHSANDDTPTASI